MNEFLQNLHTLSKNCQLGGVTAEEYRKELVRYSFISNLYSSNIRLRLLENKTLTLDNAFVQASSLEMAQTNVEFYSTIPVDRSGVAAVVGSDSQSK